jgi:hypothetical protein
MLCSCCKTELVLGESRRLESLDEHISNYTPSFKATYYCPNEQCPTKPYNVCWNEWGERYGGLFKDIPWIDGNDGAFGTEGRQSRAEDKHDEDYTWFTFPCWPRKGWKCDVKYTYQANQDGVILKRKRKLQWITARNTYHIPGWHMFRFELLQIYRHWRKRHSEWNKNQLKEIAKMHGFCHDVEWWRKASAFVAKIALKTMKEKK